MSSANAVRGVLLSSVTRKVVSTLTGLGLVVFVILHLAGNLTLLIPGGAEFNAYALKLKDFGPLYYLGEIGLLVLISLHAVQGILLKWENVRARGPVGYRDYRTKKGPSRANVSSRGMAFTGIILLAFIILHVAQFRFGPGVEQGYVTTIGGREARDLYRLIVEIFGNPVVVGVYTTAMIMLAMHLRHGIWSALQSLGLMRGKASFTVYLASAIVGLLLAVGFLTLPLYLHFTYKGIVP